MLMVPAIYAIVAAGGDQFLARLKFSKTNVQLKHTLTQAFKSYPPVNASYVLQMRMHQSAWAHLKTT
jgi:hypothetical protein